MGGNGSRGGDGVGVWDEHKSGMSGEGHEVGDGVGNGVGVEYGAESGVSGIWAMPSGESPFPRMTISRDTTIIQVVAI